MKQRLTTRSLELSEVCELEENWLENKAKKKASKKACKQIEVLWMNLWITAIVRKQNKKNRRAKGLNSV